MVTNFKKCFLLIIIFGFFTFNTCENDLLGIFGSNDFVKRWEVRNSFKFLSNDDLNMDFGDTYSFIVIADTHISDKNDLRLPKLKDVIDADDIKFIVFCGDVTQKGTKSEVKKFMDAAAFLEVPCYPVAGNHDVYFGNWPVWEKEIGSTIYRVNGGDTTLFILDSATGFFGSKQLDWLENELKSAEKNVFAFTHCNFFVKGTGDIQQLTDVRERARITSILKDKCDIMFMGHLHKEIYNKLGGVEYLAIEDYRDKAAYCLVEVTPDGVKWKTKYLK